MTEPAPAENWIGQVLRDAARNWRVEVIKYELVRLAELSLSRKPKERQAARRKMRKVLDYVAGRNDDFAADSERLRNI
jgi:hypothetical protein